jgi:hypothetical protein
MPPTNPELLGCLGSFCAPATCATFGLSCGTVGDGCGNMLDCGSCPPGETCGGGGPGVCGKMPCAPLTCASLGFECGTWGDGCGGTLDCGTCDPCTPACGQGGVRGQCPVKLVSFCMPTTCADEGIACGPTSDGCGAPLDCGACPTPLSCGKGVCLPVCM